MEPPWRLHIGIFWKLHFITLSECNLVKQFEMKNICDFNGICLSGRPLKYP